MLRANRGNARRISCSRGNDKEKERKGEKKREGKMMEDVILFKRFNFNDP